MGLLAGILGNVSLKNKTYVNMSNYIFYKIVDSLPDSSIYCIQCINTSVIFRMDISTLLSEMHIVLGLHPIQACYIGIEYAKYLDSFKMNEASNLMYSMDLNDNRYGRYQLQYLDRKGNVIFECNKTEKVISLNPTEIALSKALIQEFDAAQAFYIGLLSGLKMKKNQDQTSTFSQPNVHLSLVK